MELVGLNEYQKYFLDINLKACSIRIDETLTLKSIDTRYVRDQLKNFISKGICNLTSDAELNIATSSLKVLDSNSDLVPNEYEGGFKTWECSIDLCKFLLSKLKEDPNFVRNRTVVELGCGSGLPAILCLLHGAKRVCFQDYNTDVLRFVTAPNCILNCAASNSCDLHETTSRIQCVASSWSDFASSLHHASSGGVENGDKNAGLRECLQEKFDIILSSETLYNTANYDTLLDCVFSCLRDGNSIAYFASKRHYFGVGGSTTDFRERIGDRLTYRTLSRINIAGVQRELFSLSSP